MPTQATPYSLVYGVEVVLPLERQIPSLRIAIQEGLTGEENAKLRLQELEAIRKGSRPKNALNAIKLVFQVHSIKELNHDHSKLVT